MSIRGSLIHLRVGSWRRCRQSGLFPASGTGQRCTVSPGGVETSAGVVKAGGVGGGRLVLLGGFSSGRRPAATGIDDEVLPGLVEWRKSVVGGLYLFAVTVGVTDFFWIRLTK
jgi:hypothetical protein